MPVASQPCLCRQFYSDLFLLYRHNYTNISLRVFSTQLTSRRSIVSSHHSPSLRTDLKSIFSSRQFIRTHMGHHHDHHHHDHDNTLLVSKDTSNPGVRITRIGLYSLPRRLLTCRLVNLALVLVKAVAGVVFHSSSLLADAGHSAADILSDILTLSTITFSTRDPTVRYPLGFGKVETLGAIGVSSLLRISLVECC